MFYFNHRLNYRWLILFSFPIIFILMMFYFRNFIVFIFFSLVSYFNIGGFSPMLINLNFIDFLIFYSFFHCIISEFFIISILLFFSFLYLHTLNSKYCFLQSLYFSRFQNTVQKFHKSSKFQVMHSVIFSSKNKKRSFRTPVEQTSEHSYFFSFFPNIAVHFLFFTICFSQLFSFYIILLHTIFFYQSFTTPALLRFFLNFLSFIILLPPLQ